MLLMSTPWLGGSPCISEVMQSHFWISPGTRRDPKGNLHPPSASPVTYLGCGHLCWGEGHLQSAFLLGHPGGIIFPTPRPPDCVEKILDSDSYLPVLESGLLMTFKNVAQLPTFVRLQFPHLQIACDENSRLYVLCWYSHTTSNSGHCVIKPHTLLVVIITSLSLWW